MRPWKGNRDGAVLAAYLGCWGCKTGTIESLDELALIASRIYEMPNTLHAGDMGRQIEAIGKKERRRLAYKNIPALFPEPDETWPADIPPRGNGTAEVPVTTDGLQKMMDASKPDLIDGEDFECVGLLDIDPAQLLRKVVSAVISHDQGHILYDFPEVLAFFGSRIPQREEVAHLHNIDQRMFEAADKWPNRKPPS